MIQDGSGTGAGGGPTVGLLATRGAMVLAGLAALGALVGIRRLSVPLADTTLGGEFPPVEFPVAVVPEWVAPVSLRVEALYGLRSEFLAATVGLWLGAVIAVSVAAGVLWWALGTGDGALPPPERLGWLAAYAVVASVFTLALGDLFARVPILEWVGTLALAVVAGRLFVAPVAIVRDGLGPTAAARFSFRAVGTGRRAALATGYVLALALAYALATTPTTVAGGTFGLGAAVVAGTAVVGTVHGLAMERLYRRLDGPPAR